MAIIINIDVMLAKRKMSFNWNFNLSILKNGKAKAVRFSTFRSHFVKALECQPGDILEYQPERRQKSPFDS